MPKYFYSPLRYPGGKKFLFKFLNDIIKLNNLNDGIYIEPFCGGSGAALSLLLTEKVYKVVLNDIDYGIYAFWKSILKQNERFIKKIIKTPISISEYKKQRQILFNSKKTDLFEIGFATFYLNRCNRSGILKAGPIGGFEQDSNWNINARFNKEDLIHRIKLISIYSERIDIYNYDAIAFINKHLFAYLKNDSRILLYNDPPYYKKGNDLYRHYFEETHHISFARYFNYFHKVKWLISYDDSQFISELYEGHNFNFVNLNYFTNKSKLGREIIISSQDCILPTDLKSIEPNKIKLSAS